MKTIVTSKNRTFYKYQYDAWSQPTLTGNGIIGSDDMAVWHTFSRRNSSWGTTYTAFSPNTGNVGFYCNEYYGNMGLFMYFKNPININYISFQIPSMERPSGRATNVGLYKFDNNIEVVKSIGTVGEGATYSSAVSMSGYYNLYLLEIGNGGWAEEDRVDVRYISIGGTRRTVVESPNWPQPVISSNGSMGSDRFAVEGSSYEGNSTTHPAYGCFNNSTTSWWASGATAYYKIYNPTPICITNFKITYESEMGSYNMSIAGCDVKGSNDNNTWTTIKTFSNIGSSRGKTVDLKIENENSYNYYMLDNITVVNGNNGAYNARISNIVLTIANESSGPRPVLNYDFYRDTINSNLVTVPSRKHYTDKRYSYSDWTQPTLSSNGIVGGEDFAVIGSQHNSNGAELFRAFDNANTNYVSRQGVNPVFITFYNKNKLNVTNIQIQNGNYGDGNNAWRSGTVYAGNDNEHWTLLTTFTNTNSAVNGVWNISLSGYSDYYNYYKIEGTGHTNYVFMNQMTITATQEEVIDISGTNSFRKDYTMAGTYTLPIEQSGSYYLELIGGGGGSAQTDGGIDSYSDTGWANHYGHDGCNAGILKCLANLTPGTLKIVVGAVGQNTYYSNYSDASAHGGDSYATFTPTGGSEVEIARAYGGKSGYASGNSYCIALDGGSVSYNTQYVTSIVYAKQGDPSYHIWTQHR